MNRIEFRRMRQERNLTQEQLAAATGVGINFIGRFERNGLEMPSDLLERAVAYMNGTSLKRDPKTNQTLCGYVEFRKIRKARRLSQLDVAVKSGVAHSIICRYEKHGYPPADRTLKRMHEAIGIIDGHIDDLITGSDFCTKRKLFGLSQEDIEKLTGISQSTISRFEHELYKPSLEENIRLNEALRYRHVLVIPPCTEGVQ